MDACGFQVGNRTCGVVGLTAPLRLPQGDMEAYTAYDTGGGYWVVLGPTPSQKLTDVGTGKSAEKQARKIAKLANLAVALYLSSHTFQKGPEES